MKLIFITNDEKIAINADKSWIDRIMVDLEILWKVERQWHLDTLISKHSINDIIKIKKVIKKSKLLVRINPINKKSKDEIEKVIKLWADIIMLPMFKTPYEVKNFIDLIDWRTKNILLLETPQALTRIDDILNIKWIDEIHIWLNDLHLWMWLDFMFELLSWWIVEYLSHKINQKNINFWFWWIARIWNWLLDSSLILSEHKRLKSNWVILGRDFYKNIENIKDEVIKVRNIIKNIDINKLDSNKIIVNKIIKKIININ